MTKSKREFEINPKIKPLVDILNKVPYIQTISSCEGHYGSKTKRSQKANVIFEIKKKDEPKLEELAREILYVTAPDWSNVLVSVHKRYYVVPDGKKVLRHNWEIIIKPFSRMKYSNKEKRMVTDEAIGKTVKVVREYLKK